MTTTVRKPRPAKKTGDPTQDKTQITVTSTDGALTVTPAVNGHKAPVSPRSLMNLRVYGPNGLDIAHEVHKAGCAELRHAKYRAMAGEAWGLSALTQYDVIEGCGQDIIAEHDPEFEDEAEGVEWYSQEVRFAPCTDGLVPLEQDERIVAYRAKPKRRTRKAAAKVTPAPEPTEGPAELTEDPTLKVTPVPGTDATSVVEAVIESAGEAKAVKRLAKQDLARRVTQAIAEAITAAQLEGSATLAGMTVAEAQRCVSQWTHHLPTGTGENGKRWWPASLPRPDRSDWA